MSGLGDGLEKNFGPRPRPASEMTYTVSGGALNSTQTKIVLVLDITLSGLGLGLMPIWPR